MHLHATQKSRMFYPLLAVLALLFAFVAWQPAQADDDWAFTIEDGVLTHYNGDGGVVTIPDTVLIIGDSAFENNDNVTKVIIPASVQDIRYHAFYHAIALEEVEFLPGGNPLTIRVGVFSNCPELRSLKLPARLGLSNANFFSGCPKLEEVSIEPGSSDYHVHDGVLYGPVYVPNEPGVIVPNQLKVQAYPEGRKEKSYDIPASIDGVPVVEIFAGAFQNSRDLEKLTIPSSVTTISGHAFRNTGLRSLNIPDTVTDVGTCLFEGCQQLQEVHLPDGMTELPNGIFKDCTALSSFNWPSQLRVMDYQAFMNCSSLNDVFIPNGVSTISLSVFEGCKNLSRVSLPPSLIKMEYDPFEKTNDHFKVYVQKDSFAHKWITGRVKNQDGNPFVGASLGHEVVLEKLNSPADIPAERVQLGTGDGIVSASAAFPMPCNLLVNVLQEGVAYNAGKALDGVGNVVVYEVALSQPYAGNDIMIACKVPDHFQKTSAQLYQYNNGQLSEINGAFFEEESGSFVVSGRSLPATFVIVDKSILPESVQLNKENLELTLGQNEHLLATVLPENASNKRLKWSSNNPAVATVDSQGVVNANKPGRAKITCTTTNGKSATASVTVVGQTEDDKYFIIKNGELIAYRGPGGDVVIPDIVNKIKNDALKGNKNIRKLTIPASIGEINFGAISECKALEEVVFAPGGGPLELGLGVFQDCPKLKHITLPARLDYMVGNAFKGCSSLTEIKLDGENAHYFCQDGVLFSHRWNSEREFVPGKLQLQSYPAGRQGAYTIPSTVANQPVEKTWPGSFEGAHGLTDVTIPPSLKVLGAGTFVDTGLREVTIPATIEEVESASMFKNCKQLHTVHFEKAMDEIAMCCFENCTNLQTIDFPPGCTSLGTYSMRGCGIRTLRLPDGFKTVESGALDRCRQTERIVLPPSVDKIGTMAFSQCSPKLTLYVKENSFAHKYAMKNRIAYVLYTDEADLAAKLNEASNRTLYDETSGISLSGEMSGAITALAVNPLQRGTAWDALTAAESGNKRAWQVALMPQSAPAVAKASLSLPLIKGFDENSLRVLQWRNNSWQTVPHQVFDGEDGKTVVVDLKDFREGSFAVVDDAVLPTAITIDPDSLQLKPNDSRRLSVRFTPQSTTAKTITWSSADKSVANVDQRGTVVAVGRGSTTITATTSNGLSATCAVTVANETPDVPAAGITIVQDDPKQDPMTMLPGDTLKLNAVLKPANATSKVTWSVAYPRNHKVDENGLVTALALGENDITAKTDNGFKATFKVRTVRPPLQSFTIDFPDQVAVGSQTTIDVIPVPEWASVGDVTWSVTPTDKAEIELPQFWGEPTFIAKEVGSVTITAVNKDGKRAEKTVTITEARKPLMKLYFDPKTLPLKVGEQKAVPLFGDRQRGKTHDPVGMDELQSFSLSKASDSQYVTIDKVKGTITGVAPTPEDYAVSIKAFAKESSMYFDPEYQDRLADLEVTVGAASTVPVTGIELTVDKTKLNVGDTAQAAATVKPTNATNKNVTYSSSKPEVATITADGRITAVAAGETTITAKQGDITSNAVKVTVQAASGEIPATAIRIEPNGITKADNFKVGDTRQLTAILTPADSTSKVTWKSDWKNSVSVDENGVITANRRGSANISATTENGKTAKIKVVVVPRPLQSFTIDLPDKVNLGERIAIPTTQTPEEADLGDVTWTVEPSDAATINRESWEYSDYFEALKLGKVTVRGTTASGISAEKTVTVVKPFEPYTRIFFEPQRIELKVGEEKALDVYADTKTEKKIVIPKEHLKSIGPNEDRDAAYVRFDNERGVLVGVKATPAGQPAFVSAVVKRDKISEYAEPSDVVAGLSVTVKPASAVATKAIELSVDKTDLVVGDSAKATATVKPDNATNKAVQYVSSNPSVVRIDENGNLTAVAAGKASITAVQGKMTSNVVEVTVREPVVATKAIALSVDETDLVVGDSAKATATVKPDNATNKAVEYVSSNPSVVRVDENGNLTAVAAGKASITAVQGKMTSNVVEVTVREPVVATKAIALSVDETDLVVGDSAKATATVKPDNATNKAVEYVSSNPSVVRVDENGNLTAVAAGKASITAVQGKMTSNVVEVTVRAPVVKVKKVTLSLEKTTLQAGDIVRAHVAVRPADADKSGLTFRSSNSDVASIDRDGYIRAISAGKTTITARCGGVTSNALVLRVEATADEDVDPTVVKTTKIVLSANREDLQVGDKTDLDVVVLPKNASNKNVHFESSNSDVAKVDASGRVKAVGVGRAVLTAYQGNIASNDVVIVVSREDDTDKKNDDSRKVEPKQDDHTPTDADKDDSPINEPTDVAPVDTEEPMTSVPTFHDITGHWAQNVIKKMAEKGLAQGRAAGVYAPDASVTRAEFLTFLMRLSNAQPAVASRSFFDVPDDAWYAGVVGWGVDQKLIAGIGDGLFAPDRAIKREDAAVLLERYLTYAGLQPSQEAVVPFADSAAVSPYAQAAVQNMQACGLFRGRDGNLFSPQASFSRAEMAAILDRLLTMQEG